MKLSKALSYAFFMISAFASDTWVSYSGPQYVAMSCKAAIENVTTYCPGSKKKKGYGCACKNKAELGSWISCAYQHTSEFDTDVESAIIQFCSKAKKVPTHSSLKKQYKNATSYIVDIDTKAQKPKTTNVPIKGALVNNLYTSYHDGDPVFKKRSAGISRYYGDRTAILASYQFPLLFIFPGRNNIFQLFTRWKYSRFVTLHKWIARIVLLEMLVHAISFSVQSAGLGKTASRLASTYYRYGIVSIILLWLMGATSVFFIRRYSYQVFAFCHIVLAAVFLYAIHYHVNTLEFAPYYWTCIAIWVFDRFIRSLRVLQFGGVRNARVQLINDTTLRITVSSAFGLWRTYPGAHAFIRFLTPGTFWQTHPFTIISYLKEENTIRFYCKVKQGATKRIANFVKAEKGPSRNIWITVDGPYGNQNPYHHYDKAVFISSGNGFPGSYPSVKSLMDTSSKTEIKLYWTIPDYSYIDCFAEELSALKGLPFNPVVYVTHPNNCFPIIDISESVNESSTNSENESKGSAQVRELSTSNEIKKYFDYITFIEGRMDSQQIVERELSNANGTVAFGCCAHARINDTVRAELVKHLKGSDPNFSYFEETQVW
ncbi:hypothetical protein HII12_002228 [Brettanomyces bruxellensis]|uniref:ferric-chelate reductase (NADPH) n=1 Tax=Dekkera bruxellensis TaxID=5007 RepID=A0A8H6BJ42_DEKBR|nr:hypothetical protein HII12_002228 [Brettanomyces bruxellensis]